MAALPAPPGARADAERASAWLAAHYAAHPLQAQGWRLIAIVREGARVVVRVDVPDDQLRSILWLEEPRPLRILAGIVCPPRENQGWALLEGGESVVVEAAPLSAPGKALLAADCVLWTP